MSYCVNCGVELEKSEKKCPLCGVDILNPLEAQNLDLDRPYPANQDPVLEKVNRHFIASILSIIIAFPAVLCGAINLIFDGKLSWSLYVAGALALVWVLIVPFFLYKKPSFSALFLADAAAVLGFLLLIAWMQSGLAWYISLAMPLTALCCALIYITGLLISSKIVQGFYILSLILTAAGIMVVGIEMIINLYLDRGLTFIWSFYVLIPCLAAALVWLTIARRQSIRNKINKRLHL